MGNLHDIFCPTSLFAAGPQGNLLVIKVLLLIKYRSKALTLGEHMCSSHHSHPLRFSQLLSLWGLGFRTMCRWLSCRKNTGYHATDPRIQTQGAERGRSWIATKHGDGSLECRTHYALQREMPSFTQVQGPRVEVKPLLPAFLYCNATPREEYKVLITKL
jgi:hypothetical protein